MYIMQVHGHSAFLCCAFQEVLSAIHKDIYLTHLHYATSNAINLHFIAFVAPLLETSKGAEVCYLIRFSQHRMVIKTRCYILLADFKV